MPLVQDTAIVTTADVEAISGESGLARLDEGNATLANALIQATNYLMMWLRGDMSVDPAKVANVQDLKIPAALLAAHLRLVAQADTESQGRADRLKKRFDEAFSKYVFVSTDTGNEQTLASKGLPRGMNLDSASFFPPTDNRGPGQRYGPTYIGWSTKST